MDEGLADQAGARAGAGPRGRQRRGGRGRVPDPLPGDVVAELTAECGGDRAGGAADRLAQAARAYGDERYREAAALLGPLVKVAPGAPSVRELLGLTQYRLGRWRAAIRELEAFERLSGSVDQHPVLADCHRALGHAEEVQRLWDELRRAGVGPELLIEGRIVTAGALADGGDVRAGIRLLEQGPVSARRPRPHHLRLWYALAGLYERAGDIPRARELFGRVLAADPDFADTANRYEGLS